jgi:hypothetical protein
VTHACNPSYSGDRDEEDCGLKPAPQIDHETLSQKNTSQKRAGGVAQGVGPEFKPQYQKKEKIALLSSCNILFLLLIFLTLKLILFVQLYFYF